ncbi:MAG TPA: EAL domain-containing protein [Gemmatimonadales bacterium]|nr:EAL domain-containing protein [Gemmatimonadales bacterium]
MRKPTQKRQRPVGVVTFVTILYALGYLIWERSGWGTQAVRDVMGNVAFMPLNLTVATLCFLAAGQDVLDSGVRRALRLLGAGCVMVFIGNAISTYYLVALQANPTVSWADAFYLSDNFLMLAALLSFPLARRIRLERLKYALDAAIVVIGGAVAIWYYTIRPTQAAGEGSVATAILAFAYPLASLLVLYGATTAFLRQPLDGNRLAFGLLLTGILVSIVADLAFDLVLIEIGARSAAWTDIVYLLFYVLLTASGELYWRRPVPRAQRPAERRPQFQVMSPLPYVAMAVTYGLLLRAALWPWTDPVSGIVAGAALMTLLVVVRQLLAVRQNVRLLAEAGAEARFRSLVQNSSDVILVMDTSGTIKFASPSVARVLRRDPASLLGHSLVDLLDSDDRDRARDFLRDAGRFTGVSAPVEWRFRLPDGSLLHTEIIATNLVEDPTVRGVVLNGRNVSERKRLEQQLTHQAFHDPLTGLANRALFLDRVSHALALARRQGRVVSVLYLDLDDFKKVNDSLGHTEGDRLLVATAERLRSGARVGDTIARLGGDEFAILIEDAVGTDRLSVAVERFQAALKAPFVLSGNEVAMSMSIGVATAAPDDAADELLRNADMAMYSAKRRGKGRAESFQAHMYADVKHRLELEAALRHAIDHDGLDLVYQPIYSLRTGRLEGVEALVRWEHPRFGALLPQHFVPLAEETGLIVQLGHWVLRASCQQVKRWREARPGVPLTIAVNISGRQLHELDVVRETREALEESGIDPTTLVLEITESVLMQEKGSVLERLTQLKSLGVHLAIDDFGTGYSSLSYLQRFPIDMIKIARPFVEEIGGGQEQSALARAIIGLGDTLKLRTVAEGVERAEQCAALINLGCELGQGYFFSPPLPPSEILARLDAPRLFEPVSPDALTPTFLGA